MLSASRQTGLVMAVAVAVTLTGMLSNPANFMNEVGKVAVAETVTRSSATVTSGMVASNSAVLCKNVAANALLMEVSSLGDAAAASAAASTADWSDVSSLFAPI